METPGMNTSLLPASVKVDIDPSIHFAHNFNHHVHLPPIQAASGSDDEEEYAVAGEDDGHLSGATLSVGENSKQSSPWHRMRWTDEDVRLLVTAVAFINDEGTPDPVEAAARRRSCAVLQKKGKWKAVSKLMMEKGCYVSPQQCEDKFNDLNKRYKRLNEMLGRGTTCMVVENPALMDSMTHVSSKMKKDVKKILNSKQLFYREMCAYHNGQRIPDSHNFESRSENVPNLGSLLECEEDDKDGDDEKNNGFGTMGFNNFNAEIDLLFQDERKTALEKLEWFQQRALQLKQEGLAIQAEALELERRSFKWQRFRSKKDREMEKMRLENSRMMMKNERMILELKRKELEIDPRISSDACSL
ncbi:hypothetical protein HPP92_019686 [Vanilla planifolia]|uniref:Myb/SANT-like DNA-binding domain-containing protein n=1 Tax=Vanilla planifolia TaxID=51239 RepID=A0A835Q9A1_VANPL|nr:hypothetical protein HPP92_019686 [Vanilla planifolia]